MLHRGTNDVPNSSESTQTPKLALIVFTNMFHDIIQIGLEISFEQPRKNVFICVIIEHVVVRCDPTLCEIQARFLQVEFQHLQGFHREGVEAIPPLGVGFSA